MRVIVFGKTGQLARCLADTSPKSALAAFLGRHDFDLTQTAPDFALLTAMNPELVINTAAYTAVDRAETDQAAAFALNRDASAKLAKFCAAQRVPLIHVSTDYVFDGNANKPYRETDQPCPLNVYGLSKVEGERSIAEALQEHVIIRTSWLYSAYGQNFVKTMLRLGSERDHLRIVADQRGCPTSAHDLAKAIWHIAHSLIRARGHAPAWGLYHYAGLGETTWADFAEAIFTNTPGWLGPSPAIERIPTEHYPAPARRPRYSVLDCTKIEQTFGVTLRPWKESLAEILAMLEKEQR